MNKLDYSIILNEISETIELIKANLENQHMLRFLTGKLNLLTKSLVDTFNSN